MLSILFLAASLTALAVTYGTPLAGLARLALALSLAMSLARTLTPLVARAASRFGIVDHPDGRLKKHGEPVPYLGGVALGLSFLISLSLLFRFDQRMTGILLAGAVAVLLGLVDDLGALSWRVKLAGQCLAVLVLIKSGVVMDIAAFPGWLNLLLSVAWLLGLTNALNLIDISDGLAPGVAMFASAAFLVVALVNGAPLLAIMAATLFGALAGFAPFNFPPARIYLGDAGSMFLGLTLGGISLAGAYTPASPWGLLTPALILSVPLFDTLYVMTLRLWRGLSPFLGSPDHLAVRLRLIGWPAQSIALAASVATCLASASGIALLFVPGEIAPWVIAPVILGYLICGALLARVDVERVEKPVAGEGGEVVHISDRLRASASRESRP